MKLPIYNASRKKKIRIADTLRSASRSVDRLLLLGVSILVFFGILMVYDSSVALAIRDFSDQYYYVRQQLLWLVVGFIMLSIASKIPYKIWYNVALPVLVFTIGLLMAVFLPGVGIRTMGAHRWINLGITVIQPSEFAKFSVILYLSVWFSHTEKNRFWAFIVLLGIIVGLILLEPDLGTAAIILFIALSIYFVSGAPTKHFLFLLPFAVTGIVLLAIVAPYRLSRITTFLDKDKDPLGSSYQIRQVLLALGSGGWTGVGVGMSRQKYEYLPEANTDSIFAIIGEEVGFVGAIFVICLYCFIIWRGFRIAIRAPDIFGRLFVLGVITWIAFQTIVNLGAMVTLFPLTGIPLPFISYGGSSLVLLLFVIGIVLNISKYEK